MSTVPLNTAGVAGLAVELGRRYVDALPDVLVATAEHHGLPLVELRTVAPFVSITQAVHTVILQERTKEAPDRQSHRTVLTALALSSESLLDTAARSAALGVPLDGRELTGVVTRFRSGDPDRLPALLSDAATLIASVLRQRHVPALVGQLDDHHACPQGVGR